MKKYIPIILSGAFLVVGIVTMNDYGINWDSPEHFMRGQAIVSYFLTLGKKTFDVSAPSSPILIKPGELISRYTPAAVETLVKIPQLPVRPTLRADYERTRLVSGKRFSFYQNQFYDMVHTMNDNIAGHLPLADIMSALGNKLFYQSLGWVEDIASYQLFGILIGALGIYIVSRFTYELTGSPAAAVIAGFVLGLYPTFFTHVHVNLKDPVIAVFFVGIIWSVWHWIKDNALWWGVVAAVFFAFGMAVKWTVLFAPVILSIWFIVIWKSDAFKRWFKPHELLVFVGASIVLIGLFLYALSPFLWANPIHNFISLVQYYWNIGVGQERVQPANYIYWGFNSFPWVLVLAKTPEVVLFYILISFFAIWKSKDTEKLKSGYLIVIWMLFPLVRLTIPGLRFYGGINQFMDIIPAMAILSGIGSVYLTKKLSSFARWGIVVVTAIILAVPIVQLHPNENFYFNHFIGGIPGAKEAQLLDWFAGYGNTYKQAADWLNIHAEKDARIAHLDGPTFALSPMFLRPDITISPRYFSGFDAGGEYILEIPDVFGSYNFAYRYATNTLRPVAQIMAGGVPVLNIYKNDPKYMSLDPSTERKIMSPQGHPGATVNGQYWEIDLGQKVNVTRLVLSELPAKCQSTNTRFVDELVSFFDMPDQPIDTKAVYSVQEHKLLPDGRLEYDFAAEPARIIRIYIESSYSCFIGARVLWVSYIP